MPNSDPMPLVARRSSRPNLAMAEAVDAGIILNDQQGKRLAAAYMTELRIPFSVIVRVLAEPLRQRRAGR